MAQNVKTVLGVAIASVKTINGLAIASVQTVNGVDNTSGGGPTLVASDNFDAYTDASDLDDSATWVKEGSGGININKPAADGSAFPADANVGVYRQTATYSANQRCEITIDSADTGGNFDWIGPAVRVQTGAATCYAVVFSSTDLYLISIVAGTQATIMSDTAETLAAGDKIAIEANGSGTSTRLKVQLDTGSGWVDKWTDINPAADIDGGACGLGKWLLSSSINRVDLWAGYDL